MHPAQLQKMDAYWRAANYLSVGQIYLFDNPLLKRPLAPSDVKPMLLGHWATTPCQNFIYVHLNLVITTYDLDMIYVAGPGHGGSAEVGNTYASLSILRDQPHGPNEPAILLWNAVPVNSAARGPHLRLHGGPTADTRAIERWDNEGGETVTT